VPPKFSKFVPWFSREIELVLGSVTLLSVCWLLHVGHDSFMRDMNHLCVTWRVYMWHDVFWCDKAHSCVMCNICDMTRSHMTLRMHTWCELYRCGDVFMDDMTHLYQTWRIHTWRDVCVCVMMLSYMKWPIYTLHDASMCDMMYLCDKAHSYATWRIHVVLNDAFIHGPCIHDLTQSYAMCLKW